LSVIRSLPSTTAVPELDGILLPLIGISVVLMLFFASKKKQ